MSSHKSGQDQTGANSQQEKPSRKRHHVSKREAAFIETALGAYALLLITGGAVLFDPHSTPAIFAYIAAAVVVIGGVTIHYHHIFQNRRTLALKIILPLIVLHACTLIGTAVTRGTGSSSVAKPQIDATPRSLQDFAPGFRTGIGMTFRNTGTATAYDVTSDVSVGILPFPLPAEYPMPPVASVHGSRGTLAPGGEGDGFGRLKTPITMQQITAIVDGSKMRLYVAGTLSYKLASGQQCARHFLWETGTQDLVAAFDAFKIDHHTQPPWWEGDRFNDVNPECE